MEATQSTTVEPTAARAPRPEGVGFAWDDGILKGRKPRQTGYGIRPRDMRHRATLVRAAIHPTSTARRPIVLLVLGALLGVGGWLVMTGVIVQIGRAVPETTLIESPFPGIAGVAAYLFGIGLFSWAWQLGDRAKALKFGLTIAVVGVALWLLVAVGALLLVAIAGMTKGSSSGGGSGGSDGGSSGGGSSGVTGWLSGSGRSEGSGGAGGSSWDAAGRAFGAVIQDSFVQPQPAHEAGLDPAAPSAGEPRRGVCPFCGAAMWAEAEKCVECGATVPTGDDLAP